MSKDLQSSFDLGIEKTLYKSNDIDKNNQMRKALGIEERSSPLESNQYDRKAWEELKALDFSFLPYDSGHEYLSWRNLYKFAVLSTAGFKLEADEIDVIGDSSYCTII